MGNTILISAAYGWFIGLLVMMIVLSALFIVIALIALKPYKVDEDSESSAALRLLNAREAELINSLLHNPENLETLNFLREVATAKIIVQELLDKENGIERPVVKSLGVDNNLTEAEAMSLDEDEKVSIEQTFGKQPENGENGLEKSFTAKLMQSGDDAKVW